MVNKMEHEVFLAGRLNTGKGVLAGSAVRINKDMSVLSFSGAQETTKNDGAVDVDNNYSFPMTVEKFRQTQKKIAGNTNNIVQREK